MNYYLAAKLTLRKLEITVDDLPDAEQDKSGTSIGHARWMLERLTHRRVHFSATKANRWLGWAQCLLAVHCIMTLEDAKRINEASSCDDTSCDLYGILHVHPKPEQLSGQEVLGG